MERLGHGSLQMLQRHYVKTVPADWGRARTSEDYLQINALEVGGVEVRENAWDKWCLRLLLLQAQRFGVLDEVRAIVAEVANPDPAPMKRVDSF